MHLCRFRLPICGETSRILRALPLPQQVETWVLEKKAEDWTWDKSWRVGRTYALGTVHSLGRKSRDFETDRDGLMEDVGMGARGFFVIKHVPGRRYGQAADRACEVAIAVLVSTWYCGTRLVRGADGKGHMLHGN